MPSRPPAPSPAPTPGASTRPPARVTARQSQGTATIPYTITAKRGTAGRHRLPARGLDLGREPEPAAVTATIIDTLPGADCQRRGLGVGARRRERAVPYTCTFASKPSGPVPTTSSCAGRAPGCSTARSTAERRAGDLLDALDGRPASVSVARRLRRRPGRDPRHLRPGDVHLPADEDGRPALDADLQRGRRTPRSSRTAARRSTRAPSAARSAAPPRTSSCLEDGRPDLRSRPTTGR